MRGQVHDPPATSEARYNVTMRVQDIAGNSIPDVKVSACQGFAPECSGEGLASSGTTDAEGKVTLELDQIFFGYFLIDSDGRFMRMTLKPSQPTYRLERNIDIVLFTSEFLTMYAGFLSTNAVDPELSHFLFRAYNCLPTRYTKGQADAALAAGYGVTIDHSSQSGSQVFYTGASLLIDPTVSSTQPGGGGFGGALNVTPGVVTTINATHDGQTVATTQLRLARGELGFVFLTPSVAP
jgi:hypothetical protein